MNEMTLESGDVLDLWQHDTDMVLPDIYSGYLADGDTRGYVALENLECGFENVVSEIGNAQVGDVPALWHIYNMGYVVKTREALFSIDLVHRRDVELAPMLDFALVTHNHPDHCLEKFYKAMNGSGKTVIQNFIDNYGAADWRKGGSDWYQAGGYCRGQKIFKIKDVEIRTSLTDHNAYLLDYTMTFEIRVGDWRLFHSGDCGNALKLETIWGNPDIWIAFPGCGIDIATGYSRIKPGRMIFGHLWELSHKVGRLTTPMVRNAMLKVEEAGGRAEVPLWGQRIL